MLSKWIIKDAYGIPWTFSDIISIYEEGMTYNEVTITILVTVPLKMAKTCSEKCPGVLNADLIGFHVEHLEFLLL